MFKKVTRKQLDLFLEKNQSEKRVLDIGSGGSSYDRFFPNRLSVDFDSDRNPDIVADAHELPFEDSEFEIVLCTEVLEHLIDPRKAIREFNRVLKPGGKIILTTRFIYPIHDAPGDYWRFTKYGLAHLFSEWDNFEIISETSNFETIAVLIQRVAFQTKLKVNKLSKLLLFLIAYILPFANKLIVEEYGDIKKSSKEKDIFASGYYLTAIKK